MRTMRKTACLLAFGALLSTNAFAAASDAGVAAPVDVSNLLNIATTAVNQKAEVQKTTLARMQPLMPAANAAAAIASQTPPVGPKDPRVVAQVLEQLAKHPVYSNIFKRLSPTLTPETAAQFVTDTKTLSANEAYINAIYNEVILPLANVQDSAMRAGASRAEAYGEFEYHHQLLDHLQANQKEVWMNSAVMNVGNASAQTHQPYVTLGVQQEHKGFTYGAMVLASMDKFDKANTNSFQQKDHGYGIGVFGTYKKNRFMLSGLATNLSHNYDINLQHTVTEGQQVKMVPDAVKLTGNSQNYAVQASYTYTPKNTKWTVTPSVNFFKNQNAGLIGLTNDHKVYTKPVTGLDYWGVNLAATYKANPNWTLGFNIGAGRVHSKGVVDYSNDLVLVKIKTVDIPSGAESGFEEYKTATGVHEAANAKETRYYGRISAERNLNKNYSLALFLEYDRYTKSKFSGFSFGAQGRYHF